MNLENKKKILELKKRKEEERSEQFENAEEIKKTKLELLKEAQNYKSEKLLQDSVHIKLLQQEFQKVIIKLETLGIASKELEESFEKTTQALAKSLKETGQGQNKVLDAIKDAIAGIKLIVPVPKQTIIRESNIYDNFQLANSDQFDESNQFHGYINKQGSWFVLKIAGINDISYKYATGTKNYRQSWEKRKLLDYESFNEINI